MKLENPFCSHVPSPDTLVLTILSVAAALSCVSLTASSIVSSATVVTTFFIVETVLF